MYDVGRLCIKTAGRDAGKKCVIINMMDKKTAMIDGETRRRKCNIAHLEALQQVVKISKDASHEAVEKEFKKLGLEVRKTTPKKVEEKPKKTKKKAPKKQAKESSSKKESK